jgi:toxin ParE1/3/4
MNYLLIFHPEAEQEYLDSFLWYERSLEGLGFRFEAEVAKRLNAISKNPQFYSRKKGRFREVGIKDFPFVIVYTINEKTKTVFISSVFHTKRNPKRKYRKF